MGRIPFNLHIMAKIKFSARTYAATSKTKIKKEILAAVESSPQLRKEISRVFQQANRRIQNIEKANLISPAVTALDRGGGFTKFSMRHSWNDLKIEYSKAVSFLKQPTSTATGTREYNEHIMKTYGYTKEEFDIMASDINGAVMSEEDEDFVERYLSVYKNFSGEYERTVSDVSQQIEADAVAMRQRLDKDIDNAAQETSDALNNILRIMEEFGL